MIDSTSVLFGLEDEFVVTSVERLSSEDLRVVIEHQAREAACPGCGVVTGRVRDRPLVRVKDLPAGGQRVELWWRTRRLACREPACGGGSFTQQSEAIAARSRLTSRLRVALAEAIASGNRAVEEVAGAHGVSWPTAHRALVAAATRWLPPPEPVRVLGIDETRARSVRWVLADAGWRRNRPVADVRRCGHDRARAAHRVGPGPLRGLPEGLAGRADTGVPGCHRMSSSSTRPPRMPPACVPGCRTLWSRWTSSIWSPWPTRSSPKCGSGSPASCTAGAARPRRRCGSTGGCC